MRVLGKGFGHTILLYISVKIVIRPIRSEALLYPTIRRQAHTLVQRPPASDISKGRRHGIHHPRLTARNTTSTQQNLYCHDGNIGNLPRPKSCIGTISQSARRQSQELELRPLQISPIHRPDCNHVLPLLHLVWQLLHMFAPRLNPR